MPSLRRTLDRSVAIFLPIKITVSKSGTGIHTRQLSTHLFQNTLPSVKRTVLLSYNSSAAQIQIWDGRALLPVESRGNQIVTWGQGKQNLLLQNYPNPFTPESWIPFQLANESTVTIRIYASTGQVVRVLPLGTMPAGDYSSQSQAAYWNGKNEMRETAGSGIYLYSIYAGNFSATRKMLIRK